MMKKTSSKKIKNFVLFGFLAFIVCVGTMVFAGASVFGFKDKLEYKSGNAILSSEENVSGANLLNYESNLSKEYRYEVSSVKNGNFSIIGYYENELSDDASDDLNEDAKIYNLSGENGVRFSEIMEVIDEDRVINRDVDATTYADASIEFKDVKYSGNSYLKFSNGYYNLSGSLEGLSYSIFGLIYVSDASVMISDATFSNTGASVSYLIRAFGECNIDINKSSLTCSSVAISGYGNVHINVCDSSVISKSSSAIVIVGAEMSKGYVSGKNSIIEGVGDDLGALQIENCTATIWRGNFKNALGYGIKVDNAELILTGTPIIEGMDADIWTNETISASNGSEIYLGNEVRIKFEKSKNYGIDDINGIRVVKDVSNYNVNLFKCVVSDYDFHRIDSDLFIEKYYCIKYNANLGDEVEDGKENIEANLPVDSNHYFLNDKVNLNFLSESIRQCYKFMGWNTDSGAKSAIYDSANNFIIVAGDNIELYAIWEPIAYTINYAGVFGGVINDNPTTYTTVESVVLNEPVKQYYKFLGWTYDDVDEPTKNVVIDKGSYGTKTFTAHFEIATYKINYHNITEYDAQMLCQKLSYSIMDNSFKLDLENFMVNGYSVYGIYYDKDMTLSCDGDTIYFKTSELAGNSESFKLGGNEIGKDIDIYIDAKMFHNGEGLGTSKSPYIIDDSSQFATLLSGMKYKNKNVYIAINKDIDLSSANVSEIEEVFANFEIDGRGHTLKVNALNNYGGYMAVFPIASNVVIKNLKIEGDLNLTNQNSNGGSAKIGSLIGIGQNIKLQNIQNKINLRVVSFEVGGSIVSHYISNLICKLNGGCNVVDNVQNAGKIEVVLNDGRNVECYASAFVAEALGAVIVNCVNNGDLRVVSNISLNYETMIYAGAMANLNSGSYVLNSINYANVSIRQLGNCWAVASGVANVIGNDTVLNGVANCGKVEVVNGKGEAFAKGFNASISFGGDFVCSVKNAYSSVDNKVYSYDKDSNNFVKVDSNIIKFVSEKDLIGGGFVKSMNTNLNEINEVLAQLNEKTQTELEKVNDTAEEKEDDFDFVFDFSEPLDYVTYGGVVASKWYVSNQNGMPTQTRTLIVKFDLGGVLDDVQKIYDISELKGDINAIFNNYNPLSYKKHFFMGWYMDDKFETKANLENIDADSVTLYAKWEPLTDRVNSCMTIIVVIEILMLIVILLIFYLIDKKKYVTFIVNGKIVEQKVYARREEIEKPIKDCTGEIWFMDEKGKKVFTKWKMPYYPLNLWQFDKEKQNELEKEYNDKVRFEIMAKEQLEAMNNQIAEEKKKTLKEKNAQKEKAKIEKEKIKLDKQVQREKEAENSKKLANEMALNGTIENDKSNLSSNEKAKTVSVEVNKNKKTAKNIEKESNLSKQRDTKNGGKKAKENAVIEEKKQKKNIKKSGTKQSKAKEGGKEELDSNITIIQKEITVRKNDDSKK